MLWAMYISTKFDHTTSSSDREKLLKLEAEGQEFANLFRSLEQFIQFLVAECFFYLVTGGFY